MEERLLQLQKEVSELINWIRSSEQLPYPLGVETKKIALKDLLVSTGQIKTTATFDLSLEVLLNDRFYWISAIKS